MSKPVLLITLAMASVFIAHGAPLCSTVTPNYAALVALGSGGCMIHDLLFSNFSFAGSATGNGITPVASQVAFTLDDPGTSTLTGQLIYGFEFNPNEAVIGPGSVDEILMYDITGPSAEIASNHLLLNGLAVGSASAFVSEGPDCGKTTLAGGCTFLPIISVTTLAPHQDALDIGPFIFEHISKDIGVLATNASSVASISNVRDAVDETPKVPETGSIFTMAAGLIAVGCVKLRRKA